MPEMPLIIESDLDDPDCAEVLVDGTVAGRPYRFLLIPARPGHSWWPTSTPPALVPMPSTIHPGVFAASANPLVVVPALAVGPLAAATLEVERVDAGQPGAHNLLGMNVLRHHCCRFRFDRNTLWLERSPAADADRALLVDPAGHPYGTSAGRT